LFFCFVFLFCFFRILESRIAQLAEVKSSHLCAVKEGHFSEDGLVFWIVQELVVGDRMDKVLESESIDEKTAVKVC
jgi:hypothetical protein